MALLSDDERLRATRFHSDRHRVPYARAHALLRRLLARYLGVESCAQSFRVGPHGKPSLDARERLRFNLAHSGDQGLAAFALDTEIGVDLELMTRIRSVEEVAERFFSPAEQRGLAALPAERRRAGFFHVWSQKEAYLKGRGDGVARGLDHFDVEADPAKPAALLADRRDPAAIARWRLFTLDAGPESRAALAVEAVGWDAVDVRYFDWPAGGGLSRE